MKCQEGLIYDKNLRSCAIPGEDWECRIDSDKNEDEYENEVDENNVYGIENLEVPQDEPESDDGDSGFLEMIDENLAPEARVDSMENEDVSSGDGELVTPPSPTVRMITTQLQRLTQLVQHVQDKNDGVINDDDVTPEDLNSFLATQKVQSDSIEYQKTNFNSHDKTPMPSSGRIHPEILSEVLDHQSQLNAENVQLTTLSMDLTTPRPPKRKPSLYINDDPITEIQLKSAQAIDGTGSHQIVVNRPEGSVMFNVPPAIDNNQRTPYFSDNILKAILEISKQMVKQNHQKQAPQVSYAPQPFYYGVPIPIISPQHNSAQGYYGSNAYQNNQTDFNSILPSKKKQKPNKVNIEPVKPHVDVKLEDPSTGFLDSYGYYHANKPDPYHVQNNPQSYQSNHQSFQNNHQSFQNPSYYYQNYPGYTNGYNSYQQQQPQQYPPYQQQFPTKSQYSDQLGYNQQHYNFDGSSYYGNRPLVLEPSAPSYVERPKPYRKESYATSFDEDENDDNLYDDSESVDDVDEKPEKENLICTHVVQRQANQTDCYKYYVCNAKTKEVLSYTCPIFTAFNDQTKYCDASSYPACKKIKDREKSSLHNQKIYDAANEALEQVKRESQKVERIAQQVRQESKKIYNRRNQYKPSYEEEESPTYYTPAYASHITRVQKPFIRQQPTASISAASKPKPNRKPSRKKKKKVKCRDIGNIVDPESNNSYWHCFKGSDGRMKRINRQCTSNFVFCPSTRFCSPQGKCQGL